MGDSRNTHLDKPCDICGDVGFEDLLATCFICNIAREHVYCMRMLLRDVPEIWICEACRLSNDMVLTSNSFEMVNCDTLQSVSPRKLFGDSGSSGNFKRRMISETAEVKLIPTEEAIMLSSGAQKSGLSSKRTLGPSPGQLNTKATVMKRSLIGSKTPPPKFSPQNAKVTSSFRPIEQSKPPGFNSVEASSVTRQQEPQTSIRDKRSLVAYRKEQVCKEEPVDSLKPAKEVENSNTRTKRGMKCEPSPSMNALVMHEKEYVCMEEPLNTLLPDKTIEPSNTWEEKAMKLTPSPSMEALPIMSSGGFFHAEAKPILSDVQESDLPKILPLENLFPSYSALDANWCGSFEVFACNSLKFYDGFRAHLPDKVHRKAFEFSKQMPGVLQCTLLPCCSIWAEVFQNNSPDVNDVALYFFPGNFDRSRQQYVSLLELIEMQDLVLRSCINGVELLISSSKKLHVDPCGLQMESFLWGVCRNAKGNLTAPLLSNDVFEALAQSFDVGTKVRRNFSEVKLEKHLNVPPGFSKQAAGETVDKVILKNSSAESMRSSDLGTKVRAHFSEVKKENDLAVPPGFSRQAARGAADQVNLQNSSAELMEMSKKSNDAGTKVRPFFSKVKMENYLTVPPGFSRQAAHEVILKNSSAKAIQSVNEK